MKHRDIDPQLIAAAPERVTSSTFVRDTMERIHAETISGPVRKTSTQLSRSLFMQLMKTHKLAFGLAAFIIAGMMTFSGYAYAIGTDPISLIRRWVEGNTVKIDYKGRQFEHGTARTYSDAAVSAFAELSLLDMAQARAVNQYTVPHDGVEYVNDPVAGRTYVYPSLAYIRAVNDNEITFEKVYLRGDKFTLSHDMSETITSPSEDFSYYRELKKIGPDRAGKLVALYQTAYLRHKIGERSVQPITAYFAFELSRPIADYREADAAMRDPKPASGPRWNSEAVMPLMETNFGFLENLCMNNAGSTCDSGMIGRTEKGEGLYGKITNPHGQSYELTNPDAIPYGEGAPTIVQPTDIISRTLEGKITALTTHEITLKTSSGELWYLNFPSSKRDNYKKIWGHDLKVGMTLGGMILEQVDNLDNRHITDRYIYSMKKY